MRHAILRTVSLGEVVVLLLQQLVETRLFVIELVLRLIVYGVMSLLEFGADGPFTHVEMHSSRDPLRPPFDSGPESLVDLKRHLKASRLHDVVELDPLLLKVDCWRRIHWFQRDVGVPVPNKLRFKVHHPTPDSLLFHGLQVIELGIVAVQHVCPVARNRFVGDQRVLLKPILRLLEALNTLLAQQFGGYLGILATDHVLDMLLVPTLSKEHGALSKHLRPALSFVTVRILALIDGVILKQVLARQLLPIVRHFHKARLYPLGMIPVPFDVEPRRVSL